MATFKVGQRVRIVKPGSVPESANREATITHLPGANPMFMDCYGVDVDGLPPRSTSYLGCYWGAADCFTPITDPGADAFLERMRKLKPYDEPKVEPRVLVNR